MAVASRFDPGDSLRTRVDRGRSYDEVCARCELPAGHPVALAQVVAGVREALPGFEPIHATLVVPDSWEGRVEDDGLPIVVLGRAVSGPEADLVRVEVKGLMGHPGSGFAVQRPAQGVAVMTCRDGGAEVRRAWIAAVGGGDAPGAIAGVFARLDDRLQETEISPHHITRTWFYLDDIDRTYGDLNAVRDLYFDRWRLPLLPASTGVGASLNGPAIAALIETTSVDGRNPARQVSTRIQCPPTNYGPRFIRANTFKLNGLEHLNISGISSIDSDGVSLAVADETALVEFTMRSVAEILENAGGFEFHQLTSARAYATAETAVGAFGSYRDFAAGLDECLELTGRICRPDLTFEFEGAAVRPATAEGAADGR
jgi:hypothetical protein